MLAEISYYMIFGKPVIMYTGLLTLLSFIITAYIGTRLLKGEVPVKYHLAMVIISFILAVAHGLLGILLYF